ncbi:hypothetical protein CORC01_11631 [Colletotrichum orchidophilum]|uniref:Uncharacterized protein n=1 Tax=Colletotrichum orchidophilum TaxID=1209926 RepID=A0A1G4AVA2_9PEZI|nr:uncharacterized protein CORC01_11631 [Colletotrichum orchidophilum]OHE93074.1 hypothetical protein CORC01_11631 [Colletotrichum orchidophilum]
MHLGYETGGVGPTVAGPSDCSLKLSSSMALSPDFYPRLLTSETALKPIRHAVLSSGSTLAAPCPFRTISQPDQSDHLWCFTQWPGAVPARASGGIGRKAKARQEHMRCTFSTFQCMKTSYEEGILGT